MQSIKQMELTLEQALQKGVEAHKAGKVQEAENPFLRVRYDGIKSVEFINKELAEYCLETIKHFEHQDGEITFSTYKATTA